MITQMMVQPSFWVESGIKISKVRNLYLFKFADELQSRLEELLEKKKLVYSLVQQFSPFCVF
jgi:hypothetical protein